MKLRNKKTGEINKLLGAKMEMGIIWLNIQFQHREPKAYCYNSLDELNEEWEDAKEPLIKDEKIRKAVRAWAEANNLAKVQYWYKEANRIAEFSWYPIYLEIRTDNLGVANRKDEDKEFYTITELCGEEEE